MEYSFEAKVQLIVEEVEQKNIQTTSCKNDVIDSCLPVHATNEDNTYTFCGLKVIPEMSFHRGGIMLGMIINGKEFACNDCISNCY